MKTFNKLKDKLHFLTHFPYEETYREQLEQGLISRNFRSERVIAFAMLFMQIFMILVFTLRTGNIFYSFRRLRYVITYSALLVFLLAFLPVHKRSRNNWRLHTKLCTAFGILMSLWIISISYLDSLGKVSIIVYCSILPIMATFLVMPPHILSILFLFTCILTDCLVLSTPYGKENIFSILTNSIFICLLSIIYAYRIYYTSLSSIYDKMLIEQKNKQLETINKELDLLSMTDALTALGNRRYLDEAVKAPLEKYGVHMGSLTVLLLDIDHFKRYNDHHGHQQGDVCLQAVSSILSSFAENNDFRAVRYGGEEFVLVMTGLSSDSITEKAEQIRKSIATLQIPDTLGNETSVTASIGVSFHRSWKPDFLDTAIFEADQALYQAKQNGRNRVALFSDIYGSKTIDNSEKDLTTPKNYDILLKK